MRRRLKEELRRMIRGRVREGEAMSRHTTLGVGGPAEMLVEPLNPREARMVAAWASCRGVDVWIVGAGSNIVVSDKGLAGVTLRLSPRPFNFISARRDEVVCGAGTMLADLVGFTAERDLSGLEFLASIPGTVGGAVAMNAGAWGKDVAGAVKRVAVMNGETAVVGPGCGMSFGYRRCTLSRGKIILAAVFAVREAPPRRVKEEVREYARERAGKYPAGASAGCIFKNPPGDYAGRMIEAVGLKGAVVGGAQISPLHANFIVNQGAACAGDVIRLIEKARGAVKRAFGVELEMEVEILGEVRR